MRTVGGERGQMRASKRVGGGKAAISDGSRGLQRHSRAVAGAAGRECGSGMWE